MRELRLVHFRQLLELTGLTVERLQDLRDLELLDARLEQPLERRQRRAVVGGDGEHVTVREDGAVQILQVGLEDLTEPVAELDHVVRGLRDLGLTRQDLGEICPPRRLEQEAIERAQGYLVLRLDRHDSAVASDRGVDVVELDLVDLRDAQAEIDEAGRAVAQPVELLIVELRHVVPARERGREALEVRESVLLTGIDRHGARVSREGRGVVVERILVQSRDPVQKLALLVGIGRVLDLHLVHMNEVPPVARPLVDWLQDRRGCKGVFARRRQPFEGRARRRVVGLQLQQVAVQLDGARHVVQPLLVQIRDPVLEADSLGGVARHLALAQQNAQEPDQSCACSYSTSRRDSA